MCDGGDRFWVVGPPLVDKKIVARSVETVTIEKCRSTCSIEFTDRIQNAGVRDISFGDEPLRRLTATAGQPTGGLHDLPAALHNERRHPPLPAVAAEGSLTCPLATAPDGYRVQHCGGFRPRQWVMACRVLLTKGSNLLQAGLKTRQPLLDGSRYTLMDLSREILGHSG